MTQSIRKRAINFSWGAIAAIGLFAVNATAQYGGMPGAPTTGGSSGSAAGGGSPASSYNFHGNFHVGFDRPEAWGLKYFTSMSLLSGLQPPPPSEGYYAGSINIGIEVDWLPQLDPGQMRIGFNGTTPEDLNKAPIFARPVIRIGLPHKFTALVAAPPPIHLFGVTAHLLAFGLERPLMQHERWALNWRAYGQVGSVKGAFTCPRSVLGFRPGSPENPTECVAESSDTTSLRYAGSELQLSYTLPTHPNLSPHVAVGGNLVDGTFQVHAPVQDGLDRTHLWTRGGTFSTTVGITYRLSSRAAFTVDVFYSPLWVNRMPSAPSANDGLFNVRALLSYSVR